MTVHTRIPARPSAGGFFRSAAPLSLAALLNSAMGAVTWVVAARLAPPETVGHASMLVSAMLFAGSLAFGSLGASLINWWPAASGQRRRLVARVLQVSLSLSATSLVVFVPLFLALGFAPAEVVCLAVAILAWTGYQLLGPLQAAERRPDLVPIQDGVLAIARLALLPAGVLLGPVGVLASFAVPAALLTVVGLAWCWKRLPTDGPGTLPGLAAAARFAGGNWAASLAQLTGWHLVPILVTAVAGAEQGAVFYVLWTLCSSGEYAVQQFCTQMLVRGRSRSDQVWADARYVLRAAALSIPALALLALSAPVVLGLFGPHYVALGTTPFQILLLGAYGRVLGIVATTAAQALGRSATGVITNTLHTTVVLAAITIAALGGGTSVTVAAAIGYGVGGWAGAVAAGAALWRSGGVAALRRAAKP